MLVLFDGWTSFFRDRVVPWRIGMAEKPRAQLEDEVLPRYVAGAALVRRQGRSDRRRAPARLRALGRGRAAQLDGGAVRYRRRRGDRRAISCRWRWPGKTDEEQLRALGAVDHRARAPAGERRRARRTRSATRASAAHVVKADRRAAESCRPARARCASRRPRLRGDRRRRPRRAAGRARRTAQSTQLVVHARRAPVPQVLPAPARGRQSRARDRPLPHRGGAIPELRAAGRRGGVRRRPTERGRRSRCCRPTCPTRATAGPTRSTTSRASSTRSARDRRSAARVHGAYLALMQTLGVRTAELHRAFAHAHRRSGFRARAATAEDFAQWTARVRDEASGRSSSSRSALSSLPRASPGRTRAARAREQIAGAHRCAAMRRGRHAQDAPPRRLPPRAGADRQERLPHHRFRGRARAHARRAPAQAFAAARRRRHAALVQLRAPARARAQRSRSTRRRGAARRRSPRTGKRKTRAAFLAAYDETARRRPVRVERRRARRCSRSSRSRKRSTSCATSSTTAPTGCAGRWRASAAAAATTARTANACHDRFRGTTVDGTLRARCACTWSHMDD